VVLEAPDARSLASFYAALLEWPVREDGDGWTVLAGPDGRSSLAFQTSAQYAAPVWPTAPGAQQMMAHLDVEVDDLATAVEHALELGAALARLSATGARSGAAGPGGPSVLPLRGRLSEVLPRTHRAGGGSHVRHR
jgi:hypothetical protein